MKLSIAAILLSIFTIGMVAMVHVQSLKRDTFQLELTNTNQESILILLKSSLELADSISGRK